MNLFPVNLCLHGKNTVIVGGGSVAERKCRSLLAADAVVTVIAPAVTPGLAELLRAERISVKPRPYRSGDLAGAALVFAATDNREVNREVAEEARRLGILVCVADAPEEGTFTSPSVVRRGDLLISVSTGGKSPALARRIRRDLEHTYGPEYSGLVAALGALREKLLTEGRENAYSTQIFDELLNADRSRLLDPCQRERLLGAAAGQDPGRTSTKPEESS